MSSIDETGKNKINNINKMAIIYKENATQKLKTITIANRRIKY